MDNNSLTYFRMTVNLNALYHHWIVCLSQYMFDIKYQRGKPNALINILS